MSWHHNTTTETEQTLQRHFTTSCGDQTPWKNHLEFPRIIFTDDPAWGKLELGLSVDYASGGFYALRIDIVREECSETVREALNLDSDTCPLTLVLPKWGYDLNRGNQEDVGVRYTDRGWHKLKRWTGKTIEVLRPEREPLRVLAWLLN